VKLVDFGLSTKLRDSEEKIFHPCGSPGFVAPEVLSFKQPGYGLKADIFSVGAILFKLLTGHDLFKGNSTQELFINNRDLNFNPVIS